MGRQDINIHCICNTWVSLLAENKDKQEKLNTLVTLFFFFLLMAFAAFLAAPKGEALLSTETVD